MHKVAKLQGSQDASTAMTPSTIALLLMHLFPRVTLLEMKPRRQGVNALSVAVNCGLLDLFKIYVLYATCTLLASSSSHTSSMVYIV